MVEVDDATVRCLDCKYDLRGLPTDGKCPECGAEVLDSINALSLASAPSSWLARVRLGSGLLCLWGLLMGGVFALQTIPPPDDFAAKPVSIVAMPLVFPAILLMTGSKRKGRGSASDPAIRKALQWSLLLPALASVSIVAMPFDEFVPL